MLACSFAIRFWDLHASTKANPDRQSSTAEGVCCLTCGITLTLLVSSSPPVCRVRSSVVNGDAVVVESQGYDHRVRLDRINVARNM